MPKTQTTSPITARFQHFSPRWSALWAPHHLETRPHRHETGELHDMRLRHADDTPRRASCRAKPPPLASRSAEVRKIQPHREDSTRSEGVESSQSGVCLAETRTFMNVEAYRPGRGARGRWRGLAGRPVGDHCYKRRQSKPKNHRFQRKSPWNDDVCNIGAETHTKNTSD